MAATLGLCPTLPKFHGLKKPTRPLELNLIYINPIRIRSIQMLKIYGMITPANVTKVLLAAEELSVNYEQIPINLLKGEQKSDDHSRRNPFGRVPAIEHEGWTLFESNAIVRYIANLTENEFYPREPRKRAQVDQWIDSFTLHIGREYLNLFFQNVMAERFFDQKPDVREIDRSIEVFNKEAKIVDQHLLNNKFLTGNTYTIADTVAYSFALLGDYAKTDIKSFPNLKRWIKEVAGRPASKKVIKLFEETYGRL